MASIIVRHIATLANRHRLSLDLELLAQQLGLKPEEIDPSVLPIEAPFEVRRRGVEGKLVTGDHEPAPDRTLQRALARAHTWTTALRNGTPLSDVAAKTRHSASYIRTRGQLAILSPAIQCAILDGRQPLDLTLETIIRKRIPLDWDVQARTYGFNRHPNHP